MPAGERLGWHGGWGWRGGWGWGPGPFVAGAVAAGIVGAAVAAPYYYGGYGYGYGPGAYAPNGYYALPSGLERLLLGTRLLLTAAAGFCKYHRRPPSRDGAFSSR